eukprot:1138164-Pelagomonas_calceolata.AAC.2
MMQGAIFCPDTLEAPLPQHKNSEGGQAHPAKVSMMQKNLEGAKLTQQRTYCRYLGAKLGAK